MSCVGQHAHCPSCTSLKKIEALQAYFRRKLATEFGEYFEKISAMLQQIGLNLNSLRRFPRLYPHNKRLETSMVDVYRVIFTFCTDARNVFKKVNDKKVCQKGDRRIIATSILY